jgi:hypothetical protein
LRGNLDFGPELLKKALSSDFKGTQLLNKAVELWDRGLWDNYYKGSKVMGALNALKANMKHYPNMDYKSILRLSASQTNNFYGGLNLRRLARSKVLQDMFRGVALAPDWSETNFRTALDAFTPTGAYSRGFWLRQAIFWGTALQITNLMNTGHTTDENEETHRLDLELPFKDDNGKRMYINILGHLKDPLRMVMHPTKFAYGKRSVIVRLAEEQLKGTDWRGRPFPTWNDIEQGRWYGSPQQTGFVETLPGRTIALMKAGIAIPAEAVVSYAAEEKGFPEMLGALGGVAISKGRKPRIGKFGNRGFGTRGFGKKGF